MIIERKPLLALLQEAAPIARPTPPIPILSTVRLEARDGRLSARATDLAVTLDDAVPCEGDLAPICVPARLLARILELCPDDTVIFSSEAESGPTALVRVGRAEFRLRCMAAADFPTGDVAPGPLPADGVTAVEAIRAATRIMRMPQATSARAFETGVWIAVGPDGFNVLVVDGHRYVGIGRGQVESAPVCVSPRAIRVAASLVERGAPVTIRHSDDGKALAIDAGSARVVTRLVAADLPDVAQITPERAPNAVECDRIALLAAVERIDTENKTIASASEGIEIASTDPELSMRELVAAVGSSGSASLCRRYLRDVLTAMSSEHVALTIPTDDQPVRIDGAEGEIAVIACVVAGAASSPVPADRTRDERDRERDPDGYCVCNWNDDCNGDQTLRCAGCGPVEDVEAGECGCTCGGTKDCPGCPGCAV